MSSIAGESRAGTSWSFCGVMAAALALPRSAAATIAAAIQKTQKPVLVWLEFQDCCGNTESFLRASRPTVAEIVLDTLSVDYHETIMAAAGDRAEANLAKAVKDNKGKYIAVVEGSIPTGIDGAYCTIGGRAALRHRPRGLRGRRSPRSPWGPAPRSADFRRPRRTRRERSASPTPFRASRTSSTSRPVPPTPRT